MARGIHISDWETEDRLAELRALSGHTLVQIAGHIGISESTLKRWCKKSEAIRDALRQFDKQRRIAVENAIYDACFTRKVKTVVFNSNGHIGPDNATRQVLNTLPTEGLYDLLFGKEEDSQL